jgi:hypothetical protein
MHGLCGLRTGKYDSFNWKQALVRESIPKKFVKKVKIWHLLQGITLCIEHHDRCSTMNPKWHESKVNHLIWDVFIMHAKWLGRGLLSWLRLLSI